MLEGTQILVPMKKVIFTRALDCGKYFPKSDRPSEFLVIG